MPVLAVTPREQGVSQRTEAGATGGIIGNIMRGQ